MSFFSMSAWGCPCAKTFPRTVAFRLSLGFLWASSGSRMVGGKGSFASTFHLLPSSGSQLTQEFWLAVISNKGEENVGLAEI